MKIFLFLFIFLFPSIANSQNCNVKSFKKKRDVKRIIKLIENKNYSEAKNIIKSNREHSVFNALRAEIYWLEGDNENAKKIANEVLYICDEQFPVVYYILAEIDFQEKDFVASYLNLENSIKYGLDGKYYENAETLKRQVTEDLRIVTKILTMLFKDN